MEQNVVGQVQWLAGWEQKAADNTLELPPLHFPNPGRGSDGITPGKFLEFHMRFGAF